MSPDPPREDTGDDESGNRIRRFSGEFMEGLMDDEFFIVPDAPYELDMEQESDYTDSDEDSPSAPQETRTQNVGPQNGVVTMLQTSEQEFSFQGQGRGRYRLLIPFPVDNSSSVNSSDEAQISNNVEGGDSNVTIQNGAEDVGANNTSLPAAEGQISATSSHSGQESTVTPEIKPAEYSDDKKTREIDMSAEKVETIKQVMKNIVLPPQAIPTWASEIDEDVWRRKLHTTIDNKSPRNHSKQQGMKESENAKK